MFLSRLVKHLLYGNVSFAAIDAYSPAGCGAYGLIRSLMGTPQLPGVNLPTSHLLYFVLAIGLNAVVHELGHAVAAIWYALNFVLAGGGLQDQHPLQS